MLRCPKCSRTYIDSGRICRSCGAILDEVPDAPYAAGEEHSASQLEAIAADVLNEVPGSTESRWQNAENDSADEAPASDDWTCDQCGERVPGTFDVCWKCEGTHHDEHELLPMEQHFGDAVSKHIERQTHSSPGADSCCIACGSKRVIPNVPVADQGQYSSGQLRVVICGDPDALIFKNRMYGDLIANICGDCGHVQLRIKKPAELYQHFLVSQEQNSTSD